MPNTSHVDSTESIRGVKFFARGVKLLTPMQVRLARTALGLGVRELGAATDVSPSTIQRFESGIGGMQMRTLEKVQTFLESEGIKFLASTENEGPGLRLKKLG